MSKITNVDKRHRKTTQIPTMFKKTKIYMFRWFHHMTNTSIGNGSSPVMDAGPRLNIKTVLSTYGDFHVKDKTAVRTSYL